MFVEISQFYSIPVTERNDTFEWVNWLRFLISFSLIDLDDMQRFQKTKYHIQSGVKETERNE